MPIFIMTEALNGFKELIKDLLQHFINYNLYITFTSYKLTANTIIITSFIQSGPSK